MDHLGGLSAALGDNASLISDPEITATYSKDQAPFAAHQPAALVLLAKSTEEVSQAVAYANTYGIPVVARGAGSGLSGGANATSSSLVISLEKMNSIIDIDETNMIARVQAGVINLDLDKAAELKGLAYLPDPASRDWSTIGGNAATNAGGMCCVKYGVTSAHVRALTVVMADGQIVNLGSATKKAVTTLDLTRLMIGSEGTLGIITELVVGLAVRPDTPATIIATFPHIKSAAAAAAALLKFKPSMLEIIDQTTLKAVESWHPLGFEIAGSVLLMQLDEDQDRTGEVLKLCERFEMIDGAASTDAADAVEFIRVRKLAYPALERLGATLLDDVAVPISKIAELVERVEALSTKYDLTIGIFGHAGDGNMHPTIVHDHGDLKAQERAIAAFGEIVEIAQSLGGTASGEHGIGSIKQGFAAAELSPAVIELQRAIKKAFDPKGILNPGKKLP
ncbi:MAG: FAD-binding protein [Actinomycetota bacterium]|nr:FAD-binding protein [Actinomycetota bacterium]